MVMDQPIPKEAKRHFIRLQIIPGSTPLPKQPEAEVRSKEPADNKQFVEYLAKEVEHFKLQCSELSREKDALVNALNSYKLDKEVFSSKNSIIEGEINALREELEDIRKENRQLLVNLALSEKENQEDYTAHLQMELNDKKGLIEKIRTENEILKERFQDKLDDYVRLRDELKMANESLSRAASCSPGPDHGHKPTFKLRIRHRSHDDSDSSPLNHD